jgi:type VI secretion system secreted protein VgrG
MTVAFHNDFGLSGYWVYQYRKKNGIADGCILSNYSLQMKNAVNQSQLSLSLQGFSDNEFYLRQIKSENYALSEAYRFNLDCVAACYYDVLQLCGLNACLLINHQDSFYIHGIIDKAIYLGVNLDKQTYAYQLILVSPLEILKKRQTARIFLEKNIVEIVKEIITSLGWQQSAVKFLLTKDYPPREFSLQLNESDFDFLMRLLSEFGLNYLFKQNKTQWQWVIFDNISLLPMSEKILPFHSGIYRFREQTVLLPQTICLSNYCNQYPENNLTATGKNQTQILGSGIQSIYGRNFASLTDPQKLADIQCNTLDCQRQTFLLETDGLSYQIGDTLILQDHPNDNYNRRYVIVAINYFIDQKAATQFYSDKNLDNISYVYPVTLSLIKTENRYQQPVLFREPFFHILPAFIESVNDDVFLDDQGRYRVRFPFDQSTVARGQASCWIRLLQSSYGMHFPLRPGTQVAIGFIMGDLDRPLILGVIHNPINPSPVTDKNNSQICLRTFSGNELLFDDAEQESNAILATQDHNNRLQLSAENQQHKINLHSERGSIKTYAKKNLHIETGQDFQQETGQSHSVSVGNEHWILTKQQTIIQQAGQNFLATAGKNLQLSSEQETHLHTSKLAQFSASDNFLMNIRNNVLQVQSQTNNLQIHAQNNLILHNRNNTALLGQPTGGITLTPAGNLLLQGPQVCFSAPIINIYGKTIVNNDSAIPYIPPPLLNNNSSQRNKKKDDDNEDEFKLFVATVYGEAGGSSEIAWKAVGSVIMNRVQGKDGPQHKKNVTNVIENTRFDAYDKYAKQEHNSSQNHKKTQFEFAYNYLNGRTKNPPYKLLHLREVIRPIYYQKAVVTNANYYYSPKEQEREGKVAPSWISNRDYKEVKIVGLLPSDDFRFFKH